MKARTNVVRPTTRSSTVKHVDTMSEHTNLTHSRLSTRQQSASINEKGETRMQSCNKRE
jgi:hypothetical protein